MKERVRRNGRRARYRRRHVMESTRSAWACDGKHQKERGMESTRERVKRKKEKIKKNGSARKKERENNKKLIALCYSVVSKMRAHCSSIVNVLTFTIFDGANFWVINAKKSIF